MTDGTPPPPLAYSVNGAAYAIGELHRSTLNELIAQGRIRAKKIGRRTVIERTELERFVADLPDADLSQGAAP